MVVDQAQFVSYVQLPDGKQALSLKTSDGFDLRLTAYGLEVRHADWADTGLLVPEHRLSTLRTSTKVLQAATVKGSNLPAPKSGKKS